MASKPQQMGAGKPTLVIDFTPAGSVTIEAECFQGSSCAKASEHIEIALGGAAKKTKKMKPEAFAPQGAMQSNKLVF